MLAQTHSIEFQKRAYPHVQIIVWLYSDKLKHMDKERIDKLMCTEIPNEYNDVEFYATTHTPTFENNPLHAAVTMFMLHCPCNSTMTCTKQSYCTYGYPKYYSPQTELSEDRYPVYRRGIPEQGGNTFIAHKKGRCVKY